MESTWLYVVDIIILLLVLVSLPFLVRRLATKDVFFTFPLTNYVRYVERGGKQDENGNWQNGILDHYIPEVPGYRLEGNNLKEAEFVKGHEPLNLLNSILYDLLGVYWYGLYPFKHIRTIKIPKETERLEGKGPAEWIDKTRGVVAEPGLRFVFPRPFVFTDVELGDRLKVSLKLVVKLQVVRPYTPVYEFGNDFFTQTGSILQGQVIDRMKDFLTINDFIKEDKGEVDGFLREYKEDSSLLNQELIRQVGLKVIAISINDWAGDPKITKAIEQEAIETAEGDARIAKAEKDKRVTITTAEAYQERLRRETEADVARQTALAASRGAYIRATVAALSPQGTSPNVASRSASDVLEMEAATSKESKLTTLVNGQSSVALPVEGGKA